MFWYAVLYAVLMIGALCCGFFAGAVPDRTLLVKRFFIGLGIAVLCALPLLLFLLCDMRGAQELLLGWNNEFAKLNMSALMGDSLIRWIAVCMLLTVPIFYLSAFNCRRTAGSPWHALWGILLCAGLVSVCLAPAVYGMIAFLCMIGNFSPVCTISSGILGTFLFLLVLLCAWSVRTCFSDRTGWKVLLGMSVLPGLCCLAFWLAALASAQLYASGAEKKALANGVVPDTLDWKLSPETERLLKPVSEFYKRHPEFSLPFEGIYSWHEAPAAKLLPRKNQQETASAGRLIPEKNRRETLKLFQSPDFEALLAAEAAALAPFEKNPVDAVPILNNFRSYVRNRAGRAALFRETGQTEKILPELEVCLRMLKNMPRQTWLISELVLNAVYCILTPAAVSLGPDGKEYAPFYRELLSLLRSRSLNLPDETGYFLAAMRSLSWKNARFAYPMLLAKNAQEIDTHLALQSLLRQMETATETGEWDPKIPDSYQNTALVYQRGQALNILAAALKLYRSEHGAYPASLEKLVPEYLDALPVYPDTRKPYRYASDGHNFELEPDVENGERFRRTSVPAY